MKLLKPSFKFFSRGIFIISLIGATRMTSAIEDANCTNLKENIVLSSMSIQPVIEKLKYAPVIFIGENHTVYSNHVKQLEVIRTIYEKNPNIAIGMEMFTSNSDPIIADYVSEKITEAEFLKKSNYFSEWGYDYHYYKEILDFARKNKIDVIGLNIKNEIVRKIGRSGFHEITKEDLAEIPDQIDFSEESYKKSLSESFYHHPDYQNKQPDNFYLSQLVRDEYMARSASRYMKTNPKKAMIVLVGNGHVEYSYGIPQRLKRITGKAGKTIMLDSTFKPGAADYFVYTTDVKITLSPRLKIVLSGDSEKTKVEGFTDPEAASRHALKKDDEILTINEVPIKTITDIRLLLYDKKSGDIIDISIIRDKQNLTVKYPLEADEEN